MFRKTFSLISIFLVLAIVSTACVISLPSQGAVDQAATSVAGTVAALAQTAVSGVTVIPKDLPTAALPTLPAPPVIAPLRVSFVSPDRNLYTWAEGMAAPLQLTNTGDVDTSYVSPDGTLIAYTRAADYITYSLEVINSDGTNQRTLLTPANFGTFPRPSGSTGSIPYQIAWIPNSHILAFNTRLLFDGPGLAVGDTLHLLNVDTNALSNLLTVSESWKFFYSPDASKIAITFPTGMDIYNANGTRLAGPVLSYEFVNTASEYAWVASPVWSTDSTTMIVGVPPKEPWVDSPANSSVYRVAASGLSGEQTYTTLMTFFPSGTISVSPDLSKIAYFTRYGVPNDNQYTLHVANVDGSGIMNYANGNFRDAPVWSPDSTKFFYGAGDGTTTYPFIGVFGTSPIAVADYTNPVDAVWVDANRYIVSTNVSGIWRLLLGTVGSPTGLIFNSPAPGSANLSFSVNR